MLTDSEYERLISEAVDLLKPLTSEATLSELASSLAELHPEDGVEVGGLVEVKIRRGNSRERFEQIIEFLSGRLEQVPAAVKVILEESRIPNAEIIWKPEAGEAGDFSARRVLEAAELVEPAKKHLQALRDSLK